MGRSRTSVRNARLRALNTALEGSGCAPYRPHAGLGHTTKTVAVQTGRPCASHEDIVKVREVSFEREEPRIEFDFVGEPVVRRALAIAHRDVPHIGKGAADVAASTSLAVGGKVKVRVAAGVYAWASWLKHKACHPPIPLHALEHHVERAGFAVETGKVDGHRNERCHGE